jgi:hypothetical protein
MSKPTPAPARLFVILAREAPVGVIFRRGPNRWVQLIKWHTDTDTFEPGQWFKWMLYERRSDLSPDGSLLIYYVNTRSYERIGDREYTQAWTAISKPPYLTALALWPNALNYGGGGLFRDARTVELHQEINEELYTHGSPHRDHLPPNWMKIIPTYGEIGLSWDDNVYYSRLLRDGWVWKQKGSYSRGIPVLDIETRFQKLHNYLPEWLDIWEREHGNQRLRMPLLEPNFRVNARSYPLEYKLIDREQKVELHVPAQWADWDQQGRFVYSLNGKLFVGEVHDGVLESRELADFNNAMPDPQPSPDWAKTW